MFQSRVRRRFRRFDARAEEGPFAAPFGAHAWTPRAFRRRRRHSAALTILLAGLAIVAFGKLLSAMNRPDRSRAQRIGLGALAAIMGALLLSLRGRYGRRYRW